MNKINTYFPLIICILFFEFLDQCKLIAQASLPVYRNVWSGGTPTGWIDSGTGTYGTDCSTPSMPTSSGQLNDSGDFYSVNFDIDPNELDLELSLVGSGWDNGIIFRIQESINGSVWTDLEVFTGTNEISGSCTAKNYTLAAASRYIRFYYENKISGRNIRLDEVQISPICNYPTIQASNFSSPNISQTSMQVNWTRGDGDNVIVLAHENSAVDADPQDGANYTASSVFGLGSEIGTGNYVVYDGPGTNVTISGLDAITTYHFAIYEYSNVGTCFLIPALMGSATTLNYFEGSVIITEIMYNPLSEPSGEWFEVYNTSGSSIDMKGWHIQEEGPSTHTITGTLIIPAGERIVLERSAGCGSGDYEYNSVSLNNTGDLVRIVSGSQIIDEVNYNGFPSVNDGEAIQLINETTQTSVTNDDGSNWCAAIAECNVDKGTPGGANTSCILPVELIYFDAVEKYGKIELIWETLSETNNENFIIQRRTDRTENFYDIGEVAGKGFSLEKQTYHFIDESPFIGENYYRLKQVDFDGNSEFSFVKHIKINGQINQLKISPNPFEEKINIQFENDEVVIREITISDISGKIFYEGTFDNTHQITSVNLDGLIPNIYLLKITTNFEVITEMILKNRK